ncbi:carboxymuconolactone decarboxylase family protein [Flavobacterium beibuense]|uniref:Alkylhydroperoxidase AhpD core n=1 Tax=Flavobacterium beibuense TaxID=657326 RepID=A0A444WEU1_9FLAO|nr:carboxymuconolactone decarboxylase family protein [Flavobacterium beibuense]RYJ44224.1 Alkylhydroperoxidase AhpD core [Flavobacterium beibuense]
MKTISVPAKEQVSEQSQAIFDAIQKKIGKVPNLYATIGYSASALKGLLDFEQAFAGTAFSPVEKEAINLVVSQVNECDYCLAAHTMLAGMKGVAQEEILHFRQGRAEDGKLASVLQLAQSIAANKGNAPENLKEDFFSHGYDEAALIELIGLITARTFTNYAYSVTRIPVDFPAAPKL